MAAISRLGRFPASALTASTLARRFSRLPRSFAATHRSAAGEPNSARRGTGQSRARRPLDTRRRHQMEEHEVVEKRTVRRKEPIDRVTNVNVAPDGTTNVQESGSWVVKKSRDEIDASSGIAATAGRNGS